MYIQFVMNVNVLSRKPKNPILVLISHLSHFRAKTDLKNETDPFRKKVIRVQYKLFLVDCNVLGRC